MGIGADSGVWGDVLCSSFRVFAGGLRVPCLHSHGPALLTDASAQARSEEATANKEAVKANLEGPEARLVHWKTCQIIRDTQVKLLRISKSCPSQPQSPANTIPGFGFMSTFAKL